MRLPEDWSGETLGLARQRERSACALFQNERHLDGHSRCRATSRFYHKEESPVKSYDLKDSNLKIGAGYP